MCSPGSVHSTSAHGAAETYPTDGSCNVNSCCCNRNDSAAAGSYSCMKCKLDMPTVPIVRVCDKLGGIWLAARQIYPLFTQHFKCSMSLTAFQRLFSAQGASRLVEGADLRQLVAAGAVQPRAWNASILKLHVLLKKLKPRLKASGQRLLEDLAALAHLTAVHEWDETHGSALVEMRVPLPLPSSFPEQSGVQLGARETLALTATAPLLLQAAPLRSQLTAFAHWLTSGIQLDRDGNALGHRSASSVQAVLNHYLGFLHFHCSIHLPNLLHLLDPAAHAKFLKHLLEKGAGTQAAGAHAYMSSKVISFLQSQPAGKHESLDELKLWLMRAAGQIKSILPLRRKDLAIMKAAGTWVDAADLLAAILAGKALSERLAQKETILLRDAQDIHDATLACCIFGFVPPPRLTCLRECTVPSYEGPCLHPDCREGAHCKGNRLLGPAPGHACMSFVFPHHKTALSRLRARPIQYELPQELSDQIAMYLKRGRPVLLQHAAPAPPPPFLFLTRRGASLADRTGASKLTSVFKAWMARHECHRICPSICRHIFVVDRRSRSHLPGPADEHAAVAMGHSCKQWDRGIYHISKHFTAAQQAVDDMAAWRASLATASAVPVDGQNGVVLPAMPSDDEMD